jgi:ankyrin repeat protein
MGTVKPEESFERRSLAHLFSVATSSSGVLRQLDEPRELVQSSDKLMMQAAMRGYYPAQAWVIAFWCKREGVVPIHALPYLDRWNFNAIASGFLFSPWRFRPTKRPMYEQAKRLFRDMGGYNLHYCGQDMAYWDAASPGHGECVSGLVGLIERDMLGRPLHLAAALNNPQLEYMMGTNLWKKQIHTKDKNGDTPLMKCCMAGHIEALRALVAARSDASTMNEIFGYTASHWLFVFPDKHVEEAAELLLRAGADFSVRNRKSISAFHAPFGLPCGTPLHWAVFADSHPAVISIIHKSPTSIDQFDCSGLTALHMAMKMLNASLVEILLVSGADLQGVRLKNANEYFFEDQSSTTTSSSGMSLDIMVTPVHDFLCNSLGLDGKHDEDASFYSGSWMPSTLRFDLYRAGHYAESVNNVLSVILAHAPDCLFWKDSEGCQPLHHFLSTPSSVIVPEVLELLLQHGPGFHEVEASGLSPLNLLFINHPFALQDETLSVILRSVLRKLPADMCEQFLNRRHTQPHRVIPPFRIYPVIESYRPIHFAAELGLPTCLQLFIDFGADASIRTEDTDLTALDIATNALSFSRFDASDTSSDIMPSPTDSGMDDAASMEESKGIANLLGRSTIKEVQTTDDIIHPQNSEQHSNDSDSLENWEGAEETEKQNQETIEPRKWFYDNLDETLKTGNGGRLRCIEILQEIIAT